MNRTSAKIFRRAAELIDKETHHFSCSAISAVGDRTERIAYGELFSPHGELHLIGWGWGWGSNAEQKACRVLALLFMAAMVEAGDV